MEIRAADMDSSQDIMMPNNENMASQGDGVPINIVWNKDYDVSHDKLVELLKYYGGLLQNPLSARIDLAAYANKLLEKANIFLALDGEDIVAIIALYANDGITLRGHIPLVAVRPSHQGMGIGRALVCRAHAFARQRGMTSIIMNNVQTANAAARSLYESLGYRCIECKGSSMRMVVELPVMQHEGSYITPLERSPRLAAMLGLDIDLWLKRDDLYPMPGGGIKARKIGFIVRRAVAEGYDVLVTNGGPQSNHARATATIAARLGIKCHLVIVMRPGIDYINTGNMLLMRLSGATIEICRKEELASRMDQAVRHYQQRGHRPLYIWGGGHCYEGTLAFVEAANEVMLQCPGLNPDFLVLASATGSTQAGMAIGCADASARVIGISVARNRQRGEAIIRACISDYFRHASQPQKCVNVELRDEWTDGGHEEYSEELFGIIEQAAKAGVYFDPTYSGKALRGLVELVRRGEIQPGSKVLLWHTGGLPNLMAADHYARHRISACINSELH